MPEMRILLRDIEVPGIDTLPVYRAHGGYEALRKALTQMTPKEVMEEVTRSGLRGRGGAGFPTGRKWSALPDDGRPHYLVINADEGEPGTFKDRYLIEHHPHLLLEGILLSAYATGSRHAFVYVRGEFLHGYRVLTRALEELRQAGLLGEHILGTDFSCDIILYRGAGAYICGEETALLNSLEGKRGNPRYKPPFPFQAGLYGMPTVVNNVETVAAVVPIVLQGGAWYASIGTERSPGTKLFSISGSVQRPGTYEFPLGTPLRELIERAGGLRPGRQVKAVIPGGISAAPLTAEQLDIPMTYEDLAQAGSMLGSGGVIVIDDGVCIVRAALRAMEFYAHESCGWCTPCREGTGWLRKILARLEAGEGREEDLPLITSINQEIAGRTFCPFGDSFNFPVRSVQLFADDFRRHIAERGCPHGH